MRSRKRHHTKKSFPHTPCLGITASILGILALLFAACGPQAPTIKHVPTQNLTPPLSLEPTPPRGASTTGDWSTYLSDNQRSGFNRAETHLTVETAPTLKPHWISHARGVISTQAVEANGMLYWGSWDGLEHGMDVRGHQ